MQTKILKVSPTDADFLEKIKEAAEIIREGGLVVFPTETVYGLGADATNEKGAEKIFAAKGRPSDNPLIIHISEPSDAEKYAYTNELYYRLAERFMPGPLTVILNSKDIIPKQTRGGLPTVAVRCPENIIANELIRMSKTAIAAPSANLSGSPSPTSCKHAIDDMLDRVDLIIDGGDCDFGLESTIVKPESDGSLTLLRPGKITPEELCEVAFKVNIADAVLDKLKEGETAISPGMKYRHYAPRCELLLLDGEIEKALSYIKSADACKIAIISYDENISAFERELPSADIYSFGVESDESLQAHRLFYILREADKIGYERIYAPLPKKSGVGLALYNRMIRAAAHKIIKL